MELTMLNDDQFSNIFGKKLSHDEMKLVTNLFKKVFRKQFVRKKISTHGSIWSNFKGSVNWIRLDELNKLDSERYIYVEIRKNSKLYISKISDFKEYLLSRNDGIYPAIYLFDKDMTECICDYGENASLRPIILMRVLACRLD